MYRTLVQILHVEKYFFLGLCRCWNELTSNDMVVDGAPIHQNVSETAEQKNATFFTDAALHHSHPCLPGISLIYAARDEHNLISRTLDFSPVFFSHLFSHYFSLPLPLSFLLSLGFFSANETTETPVVLINIALSFAFHPLYTIVLFTVNICRTRTDVVRRPSILCWLTFFVGQIPGKAFFMDRHSINVFAERNSH